MPTKEELEVKRSQALFKMQGLKNIWAMEEFLRTGEADYDYPQKEAKRMVSEYRLRRHEGRYVGDVSQIFQVLCAKFERAKLYAGYSDLYYAIEDDRKEWEL